MLQKSSKTLDQQQLALVGQAPSLPVFPWFVLLLLPHSSATGCMLQVEQTVWSWMRGAGQNALPAFLKNKIAQNAACILQVPSATPLLAFFSAGS